MIRTEYSFKKSYGKLEDVVARVKEIGWQVVPVADLNSTFSFVKLTKLAKKHGMKMLYGVELAVVPSLGEKKPVADYWTFLAKSSLRPLHDLIHFATSNPGRAPSITYAQALAAKDLIKIAGERVQLQHCQPDASDFFIGLSPAINKGLFNAANRAGFAFIAKSDNLYPRAEDKEIYRLALGRHATTQTYPLHILSDDEWRTCLGRFVPSGDLDDALSNRDMVFDQCNVSLRKATLLKPETAKNLAELCNEGAIRIGIDLKNPVYSERLKRELDLISLKEFDDYFLIIESLVTWAKERMIVGPGRGSSGGSLVCFLLGITSVDPIEFGLIFERFIDINRGGWRFKKGFEKGLFENAEKRLQANKSAHK